MGVTILQALLFLVATSISQAQPLAAPKPINRSLCSSVASVMVFGDSTVDSGNNNYLATLMKSDFSPYGRDFSNRLPTGRFTNGRLTTDFLASYLGIKDAVPPYLDDTLSEYELQSGVSFASAGTGFDPITAQITGVIPVMNQLEYFKEYLLKLDNLLGRQRRENIVKHSLFILSAGTNDLLKNYFITPFASNVDDYLNFLIQSVRLFLQEIMRVGARKIAVIGLPPVGCLPLVTTLSGLAPGCIESFNEIAVAYNEKLIKELNSFRNQIDIIYADIYTPIFDMVNNPSKYGFSETRTGCCGTGLLEAAILCNPLSPVCEDASEYVFWDAVHPTEKTYLNIFKSLLHLTSRVCRP